MNSGPNPLLGQQYDPIIKTSPQLLSLSATNLPCLHCKSAGHLPGRATVFNHHPQFDAITGIPDEATRFLARSYCIFVFHHSLLPISGIIQSWAVARWILARTQQPPVFPEPPNKIVCRVNSRNHENQCGDSILNIGRLPPMAVVTPVILASIRNISID